MLVAAGPAKIGQVECTKEYQKYVHPQCKHLVLWDLPGAGSVTHGGRTYFKDKALYAFDCLIIVMADRLMHLDLHLINVASMYGLPTVLVRTKIDQDFEGKRRRVEWSGKSNDDVLTALRQEISDDCASKLQDLHPVHHSNWSLAMNRWLGISPSLAHHHKINQLMLCACSCLLPSACHKGFCQGPEQCMLSFSNTWQCSFVRVQGSSLQLQHLLHVMHPEVLWPCVQVTAGKLECKTIHCFSWSVLGSGTPVSQSNCVLMKSSS